MGVVLFRVFIYLKISLMIFWNKIITLWSIKNFFQFVKFVVILTFKPYRSILMKTLMIIASFISIFCYAEEWQNHWIKGVECCEEKQFNEASYLFDLAIESMEAEGVADHPHVYVDRARLNLLLNRTEEAISDLDKALSNEKINYQEKLRALVSRFIARAQLGIEQGALEDLKTFGELKIDKPVMEMTEKKIIIRNIPDSECYRKIMTCYFIHSGMCNSKKDIKMLKSGICLVDRACDCECENLDSKDRRCDACGAVIQAVTKNNSEASCRSWCDRATIAGGTWCGRVFKSGRCQGFCALVVYELQQGCYWCCEGGKFYKTCVKPFEDILAQMGQGCDPAWD
jgi:hypothetical protein